MISKLSHAGLWVLDQDDALRFYTEKLGFDVRTDVTLDGGFRWLTVGPPAQPDMQLILLVPGPPMLDDASAAQVKALIARGSIGSGVFETRDCRATCAELKERGVEFIQEPTVRFYGIEATFRDNSGNWFSLTQRAAVPIV
jgi:catechol 2,3-dioxygenase-like lactoylglutathione lyase family enzyme